MIIILLFLLAYKYPLENTQSTKIYDVNWIILYDQRGSSGRQSNFESLNDAPADLITILLQLEDRRFWNHNWFDLKAFVRAMKINLEYFGYYQWASTIDQQVIKLSQKAYKRSLWQKFKEIFLAWNINMHYSKNDILLYYINNIQFPSGVIWYHTACQIYFNTVCKALTKEQLLFLYGLSRYSNKELLYQRVSVLSKWFWLAITPNQVKQIDQSRGFYVKDSYPFFVQYILSNSSWGQIFTKFDSIIASKIDWLLSDLRPYLKTKKANDACVVLLDHSGNIISMNTLRKYQEEEFGYVNWCIAPRQVWSAMKPFLYIYALKRLWLHMTDTIVDEPVSYFLDNWWKYEPQNFSLHYYGKVTLNQALGSSLNIPAVKLLHDSWLDGWRNFLATLGKETHTSLDRKDDYNSYGLSLALGSKEISPLDFTRMRTIFHSYKDIHAFDEYTSYIEEIRDSLSQDSNRSLSFGANSWLTIPATFIKTWTSRSFVDWWACGGFLQYSLCVWTWNYDGQPMLDSWVNTSGLLFNKIARMILGI